MTTDDIITYLFIGVALLVVAGLITRASRRRNEQRRDVLARYETRWPWPRE